MSADNCGDCKELEKELDYAKVQIQTLDRLIESQKDQIDHLQESVTRGTEQGMKVMMELQRVSMEVNARLIALVEKALLRHP